MNAHEGPAGRDLPTGYLLLHEGPDGEEVVWARCAMAQGLFAPPRTPRDPLRLLGCESTAELREALRGPRRMRGFRGWLRALDREGRVLRDVDLESETVRTTPSVLGGTLLDIVLEDGADDRPDPSARPVWELWHRGVPREAGLWRALPAPARREWLRLAMANRTPPPGGRAGPFRVDGRAATDEPGLYCALSEAVAGPGRYYGWNLDALDDCLRGGFGPVPPFTLVWEHLEESRRSLPGLADAALEVLRERGAEVLER